MPDQPTYLLYRHDDGRWIEARIVQQIRSGPEQRWRVLVTYSAAPGYTYTRGEWADSPLLRPLHDQLDEKHDASRGHGDADREYRAAQHNA